VCKSRTINMPCSCTEGSSRKHAALAGKLSIRKVSTRKMSVRKASTAAAKRTSVSRTGSCISSSCTRAARRTRGRESRRAPCLKSMSCSGESTLNPRRASWFSLPVSVTLAGEMLRHELAGSEVHRVRKVLVVAATEFEHIIDRQTYRQTGVENRQDCCSSTGS